MELSNPELARDLAILRRRVAEGPGVTPRAARCAAMGGERAPGALGAYLDRVRHAPTNVTDAEVAALRASGISDDALFELTIASALGAADERLSAALAAIAAAEEGS